MKKIVTMLSICFSLVLLSNFAQAELPPKVEGENFQRVEDNDFVNPQHFLVPAFEHVHPEVRRTVCAYKVFLEGKDSAGKRTSIPMLMLIETNPKTSAVKKSYLPYPEKYEDSPHTSRNLQHIKDMNFVDIQQLWVPKFKKTHPEVQTTICGYKVFLVCQDAKGNKQDIPIMMLIEVPAKKGAVRTSYLPYPDK